MTENRPSGADNITLGNPNVRDGSSKLIFGDNILTCQFLRDYADLEILRHIQPEDLEDVSERYVRLHSTERNSDTVKKVDISKYFPSDPCANPLGLPLYIISLVEHKSRVEYNVIMQVLRYMVYIWEDYEKDMERLFPGISSRKDFRYPPILPIVYYEGTKKWTAPADLADKIFCGELLGKYLPHFRYQLIMLHEFSNEELLARKDEISLAMLINKIQTYEDVSAFSDLPQEQIQHILKNTPENILEIMAEILRALLYRIKLPENTVEDTVAKIKERKMGILFENVQMDFEEEKRKADEATRKADEVQRKADEQLQIYGEIITLLKQGKTDEEIIAHFMQCFSWSEEQAREKASRFLLSS